MPKSRMFKSLSAWRAAAMAQRLETDAVSMITPSNPSGRPRSWRSQSTATCSSSVAAGDVCQSIPFTFKAADRSSPRMPGAEPVMLK